MYDDAAYVGIRDFVASLILNYEFIMDPPLMGDIGLFRLKSDNITF